MVIKVEHPNGYAGVLYGKSSMAIYDKDGHEVLHTGFRTPNTKEELYETLEDMPRVAEMIAQIIKADRKTEPQIHGLFREDELSDDDVKELKKQIGQIIEYADRKTENSLEIPNNCEDLQDWKDRMWTEAMRSCGFNVDGYRQGQPKDEPTSSKMEQVETMSCAECKHRPIGAEICEEPCHYEPQTDWHYDEQDATWYPYKHEDEPQTERSE